MEFEGLIGIFIGIGLSATCGFRVFVPLLGMSIAFHTGHLTLSPGFEWIGSWPAIVMFSTATVLEIAGYYIAWVDNILDTIATPAAVIAGTLTTASMVGDVSPLLRWSLALIAGGGIAGLVQGSSVLVRGKSSLLSAGIANPAVSTTELIASVFGTIISILLPVIAIILVLILVLIILRRVLKRRKQPT
jgi:hypothetical protein